MAEHPYNSDCRCDSCLAAERGEFRFDWQKEPKDSFLKWFLPHVLAGVPNADKKGLIEQISEASDRFTKIKVRVELNGVAVPVREFLGSVESNIKWMAAKEAQEMVQMADLGPLVEVVDDLQRKLNEIVRDKFAALGIELPESY